MKKLIPLRLLGASILLAGAGLAAQNADLSLMVGPLPGSNQVVTGTNTTVITSTGGALQIDFGYQVLRTTAGDLWVETPLTFAFTGGSVTASRSYSSVSDSGWFCWTPGVRFRVPVESHISFYGVAGGGIGTFGTNLIASGPGSSSITTRTSVKGVFDFGGGMDFRLTRLLSLRGEVRDFATAKGLAGTAGHHHLVYDFGLAFHF